MQESEYLKLEEVNRFITTISYAIQDGGGDLFEQGRTYAFSMGTNSGKVSSAKYLIKKYAVPFTSTVFFSSPSLPFLIDKMRFFVRIGKEQYFNVDDDENPEFFTLRNVHTINIDLLFENPVDKTEHVLKSREIMTINTEDLKEKSGKYLKHIILLFVFFAIKRLSVLSAWAQYSFILGKVLDKAAEDGSLMNLIRKEVPLFSAYAKSTSLHVRYQDLRNSFEVATDALDGEFSMRASVPDKLVHCANHHKTRYSAEYPAQVAIRRLLEADECAKRYIDALGIIISDIEVNYETSDEEIFLDFSVAIKDASTLRVVADNAFGTMTLTSLIAQVYQSLKDFRIAMPVYTNYQSTSVQVASSEEPITLMTVETDNKDFDRSISNIFVKDITPDRHLDFLVDEGEKLPFPVIVASPVV